MNINLRPLLDLEFSRDLLKVVMNAVLLLSMIGLTFGIGKLFFQEFRGHSTASTFRSEEEDKLLQDRLNTTQQHIAALEASIQQSNDTLTQVLSHTQSQTGESKSDRDVVILHGEVLTIKSQVTTIQASLAGC